MNKSREEQEARVPIMLTYKIIIVLFFVLVIAASIALMVGLIKPSLIIKRNVKWKRVIILAVYIVFMYILTNVSYSLVEDIPNGDFTESLVNYADICFVNNEDANTVKAILNNTGVPSKMSDDNSVLFQINENISGMYKDGNVVYVIEGKDAQYIADDYREYCKQHGGVFYDNGYCKVNGYGMKLTTNLDGKVSVTIGKTN